MLTLFICFALILAAQISAHHFETCESEYDLISFEQLDFAPYPVHKGDPNRFKLFFTPQRDLGEVTFQVRIGGGSLFKKFDLDGCKRESCPYKANEPATYIGAFDVNGLGSSSSFTIKVLDERLDEVGCIRSSIEAVDSPRMKRERKLERRGEL